MSPEELFGWSSADSTACYDEFIKVMREKHLSGEDVTHKPPFVTDDPTVAVKADDLKPVFDLLPWDALAEVSKVMQFGKVKYSARNWENGFEWLRLWNSAMRHLTAWERGEEFDNETHLSHSIHAAFCVLALVAHEIRGIGTDNRHK